MPATLKPEAKPKRRVRRDADPPKKPPTPAAGGSGGAMAGAVEAVVELGLIVPSPHNPRKNFDDAALAGLAESLKTDGQLQNVTVRRPKAPGDVHVLIGGERRYRAAMLAGLRELRCLVVDVDDATAVRLCGIENYQREQLDPIEEASWFRDMLGPGGFTSQAELAAELGVSQPKISQRLDLLALPEAWQKHVISAAIPLRWVRHLTKWKDRPEVLVAAAEQWPPKWGEPHESDLERAIAEAVREQTVLVSGWIHGFSGNVAPPTKRVAAHLDAVDLGHDRWVAFNKPEAERYVADKLAKSRAKRAAKAGGKDIDDDAAAGDAGEQERALKRADLLRRKLAAHRELWFREAVRAWFPQASTMDVVMVLLHVALRGGSEGGARQWWQEAFREAGVDAKGGRSWHGSPLAPLLAAGPAEQTKACAAVAARFLAEGEVQRDTPTASRLRWLDVEQLAAHAGITLAGDWRPDAAFLELFDGQSLRDLVDEWKLEVPMNAGLANARESLLDRALAAKVKPPKALLAAKPRD